jgi:D-glycero-D-manno-heptose 1,7-bisphosphate phosphatase
MTGKVKAVFLDRDGVINKHKRTLVKSWSDFKFLPGVKKAIKKLVDNDFKIIVVTNQDVVGWGIISETKLKDIHKKMTEELEASGVELTDIFYCPHNPVRKCSCRKPAPGMLTAAAKKHKIDSRQCWMVGDKSTDVQAGASFGCRTILIKKSSRGEVPKNNKGSRPSDPDHIVKNLEEAVEIILQNS